MIFYCKEYQMQTATKKLFVGLAAVMAIASASIFAQAETQVAKDVAAKAEKVIGKLKASCESDVQSYCSKVTPGEGRLLLCMMAHEDKISDKCYASLLDAGDAIELTVSSVQRAVDVCEKDIGTLCGKVEAGGGKIAQCLIDNMAKLSAPCGAEVTAIQARIKK